MDDIISATQSVSDATSIQKMEILIAIFFRGGTGGGGLALSIQVKLLVG